jgi:broad specificity phosphatase PhoE
MTLYLVRHGRAEAGIEQLDPGLDEVGKSQAERAAAALSGVRAKRLICSPLRRARETAAPIASALALTPEIREEVAEVFDPAMGVGARRDMLVPLLSGKWSEQPAELVSWRSRTRRSRPWSSATASSRYAAPAKCRTCPRTKSRRPTPRSGGDEDFHRVRTTEALRYLRI